MISNGYDVDKKEYTLTGLKAISKEFDNITECSIVKNKLFISSIKEVLDEESNFG